MAGIDPALVLALQHRVACDQLAVLEDSNLGGMVLDLDNPPPCCVGDTVLIASNSDHPFLADPPFHGQHRIVGMGWQGNKLRLFFDKMLIHDPLGGSMHPGVGDGHAPLLELGVQVVHVAEAAPKKEVLPHIPERPFNLARRPLGLNQWRLNGQLLAR